MTLASPRALLAWAAQRERAVCAFNIHAADIALGVLDAAEKARLPVILQVNEASLGYAGLDFWAGMAGSLARQAAVPVAVQLDHARRPESVASALAAGFTGVMFDGSHLPFEENVRLTAELTSQAHLRGAALEAELGRVAGTEDGARVSSREATFTDPEEARLFAARTGVDALAVAIGTVHGFYKGEPFLDFPRLERLQAAVAAPLVLHGASGVADADLVRAVRLGVRKINFATELKQSFAGGVRRSLAGDPAGIEPFTFLGAGREDVAALVGQKLSHLTA